MGIRGNEAGRFDSNSISCNDFPTKRPASFPLFTKKHLVIPNPTTGG